MPIEYVFVSDGGYVLVTFTGDVDDLCLLEYSRKVASEYPKGVPELADLRGLSEYSVTPDGMKRVAEFDAAFAAGTDGTPVAVVVGSDLTYGMTRMYQMFSYSNPNTIEIFRNISEAEEWLLAQIAAAAKDEIDPVPMWKDLA